MVNVRAPISVQQEAIITEAIVIGSSWSGRDGKWDIQKSRLEYALRRNQRNPLTQKIKALL
jgi:hypothetical protein